MVLLSKQRQWFLTAVLAMLCSVQPAFALVDITTETVNQAIEYGINNAELGLANLLGDNWIEGPDGMLINVYSPFMVIAAKVAKGGYAIPAKAQDIKAARARYNRTIRDFVDENKPDLVKFSVSLYGDTPEFAGKASAWIEGIGRGKEFRLKPTKQLRDKIANPSRQGLGNSYEAINAYYFNIKDLLNMDKFRFYIQPDPVSEPIVINIVTNNIK